MSSAIPHSNSPSDEWIPWIQPIRGHKKKADWSELLGIALNQINQSQSENWLKTCFYQSSVISFLASWSGNSTENLRCWLLLLGTEVTGWLIRLLCYLSYQILFNSNATCMTCLMKYFAVLRKRKHPKWVEKRIQKVKTFGAFSVSMLYKWNRFLIHPDS